MTQPLAGRTVVITRASSQAGEFSRALESLGATVIACPTIEIAGPESYEELDEALSHLYGYDWLILTSTNGVHFFLRRLAEKEHTVADLDEIHVCAIGEATAEALREAHVHVDLVADKSRAEGVYCALTEFLGGKEQLAGLNFLLPRAAIGRAFLPNSLRESGARVDVVTAYRTVLPENIDRGKLGAMLAGTADCIAFTSSSTVKNLALLFETDNLKLALGNLTIACIGEITAETAVEYGLSVDIQPRQATVDSLAQYIADYYAGNDKTGDKL